jgi:hypothetical protein
MEKPSRDFKGIWIPKDIWLSDQLSLMEKVLFVEIHSLDNERGCFAGNRYFAEFFGLHPRRLAGHIASLKQKGFISVTIHNLNEAGHSHRWALRPRARCRSPTASR